MSSTILAGYLALFILAGGLFLMVNLILGRFIRPDLPNEEKVEVYECGEPTIGSSFVQFDLRFYVVALLFIIFDVEVALFFPWANVFGTASHLRAENFAIAQPAAEGGTELTPAGRAVIASLGVPEPTVPNPAESVALNEQQIRDAASKLALASMFDIAFFISVLVVGFAYVWRRGDLNWVRALSDQRKAESRPPARASPLGEPMLVG